MSLHYIYSNASNSTLDITQYCRLYRYSASTDAKEGSVAHSTLIVDDPDGILDFVGHRRLYTYEDLAPAGRQVVHNGFIERQRVSRGPFRIGAGRIWTLELADQNVLLNRRLMNGDDADRDAETDVERMEALIGLDDGIPMTELNTIDDTLYFGTSDPVDMDAADYRTQPAGTGYIDDCAQASGKNYFAWYREATGEFSLWYDFAQSSNWVAPIRISNVIDDVDDVTTFAVDYEQEAELDRDPSRIASGVMLPFDGVASGSETVNGTVYVQNAATTAAFGAIDWLAPSLNVKTKAMALARANRYLADADEHDDIITCSVKLPAANVNDILAGQLVDGKFFHLPGYEEFTTFRCLSRTVNEISEDPTRAYRLDLELSPIAPIPTEQYGTVAEHQQQALWTWPLGVPGDDLWLLAGLASRSTPGAVDTTTVPSSFPDTNVASEPIPGTEYTNIDGFDVAGAGGGGIALAWRDSTVADTEFGRWDSTPTATFGRPRMHYVAISGFSGAPDEVETSTLQTTGGTTYTSPVVTMSGAGYVWGIWHFATSGPHDRFGWGGFSVVGNSPTVALTGGWMESAFGGYSVLCYRYVTGAGSYTLSLERVGEVAYPDDPDDPYGWIAIGKLGAENPGYPG